MKFESKTSMAALVGLSMLCMAGCSSSMKAPATADVAVSNAAVDNATSAGGVQYAPEEMALAREKLAQAQQAMKAKDYKAAADWAKQAQADAKLAQAKANSSKAQEMAAALQEDIRVLRVELDRSSGQ